MVEEEEEEVEEAIGILTLSCNQSSNKIPCSEAERIGEEKREVRGESEGFYNNYHYNGQKMAMQQPSNKAS